MTRKLEKNLELGRKQMITPGEEGRKRIQKVSAYSLWYMNYLFSFTQHQWIQNIFEIIYLQICCSVVLL